jgi:hypothetical protein
MISCKSGPGLLAGDRMQLEQIKRRIFITLLGGAAAAWPLAARGQQAGKLWRICYLSAVSRESSSRSYAALQQGMRELGYVEGKDFVLEWRSVEGKYERFPEIIGELVRLKVDVIVTGVTAAPPGAAAGNHGDSHCHGLFDRSRRQWPGREPGASRWQYHWIGGLV